MAAKPAVKKAKPNKFSPLDSAYAELLDTIDRQLNLGGDLYRYRQSTGVLAIDLCIGGGLVPGMTVIAGSEQSAKSTLSMHVLGAALAANIPIIKVKDPEGSTDPDYTGKILKVNSLSEVFGEKLKGTWIKLPRARYSDDSSMSVAFDDMVLTLNRLPDKRYLSDRNQWFFVLDSRDKRVARFKTVLGKPDREQSRDGKLWFPTDNPAPQAMFIIDSAPLLSPDLVEEKEADNAGMALIAREYAKQFPRVIGKLRRKAAIIFMVNVLRQRPGVMYGPSDYEPCFTAGTTVITTDGVDTIGNIVNKKRKISVLSYNPGSMETEWKDVIGWKNNGRVHRDKLMKLTYAAYAQDGSSTTRSVTLTKNHEVYTDKGKVAAGKLKIGDAVRLSFIDSGLSNNFLSDAKQLVLGAMLGDGGSILTKVVNIEPPDEKGRYIQVFDLKVADNHNYHVGGAYHNGRLANGQALRADSLLVSNCGTALQLATSCRLWSYHRAVPKEWRHDAKVGAFCEEDSVEGDGVDHYQYKYIRNKKNKTATPFLDCWIRIWVRDRKGKGRGIDPVFDTAQFLFSTGLARRGRSNSIEFVQSNSNPHPLGGKTLTWADFKLLVLAEELNNKTVREAADPLRKKLKLDPKYKLRAWCFKIMRSGTASALMNDRINLVAGSRADAEDLEE